MLLVHGRDIVEPVEVGHILEVGARLHQLLGAPVQEADVRIDPIHHLAVQLQDQAQHAVRRRVLGPEVDVELADGCFRKTGGFRQGGTRGEIVGHQRASPFSSPGRT